MMLLRAQYVRSTAAIIQFWNTCGLPSSKWCVPFSDLLPALKVPEQIRPAHMMAAVINTKYNCGLLTVSSPFPSLPYIKYAYFLNMSLWFSTRYFIIVPSVTGPMSGTEIINTERSDLTHRRMELLSISLYSR